MHSHERHSQSWLSCASAADRRIRNVSAFHVGNDAVPRLSLRTFMMCVQADHWHHFMRACNRKQRRRMGLTLRVKGAPEVMTGPSIHSPPALIPIMCLH